MSACAKSLAFLRGIAVRVSRKLALDASEMQWMHGAHTRHTAIHANHDLATGYPSHACIINTG